MFEETDLSRCHTARQAITALAKSDLAQRIIDDLCRRSTFREFSAHDPSWLFGSINEALESFMQSGGDIGATISYIRTNYDTSDSLHDLVRDTMNTSEFAHLVEGIRKRVLVRFPETRKVLANLSNECVLDQVISKLRQRDTSKPIDILRDVSLTAAYVPGYDAARRRTIPKTSNWGNGSDILSIKPDTAFIGFLSLLNISKGAWMKAVHDLTGQRLDEPDGTEWSAEREDAWLTVRWQVVGRPLIDLVELASAVDACPFGFTPMLAFNVDVHRFCTRDWDKPLSISGGIIGLHDFKTGTGNPLPLESTCTIIAKPSQFLLPENMAFGFSFAHGFTERSFDARVKDATGRRAASAMVSPDVFSQLGREFNMEEHAAEMIDLHQPVVDRVLQTGFCRQSAKDVLKTAVEQKRKRHLSASLASPADIHLLADRQLLIIEQMDDRSLVAAVIGQKGRHLDRAAQFDQAIPSA